MARRGVYRFRVDHRTGERLETFAKAHNRDAEDVIKVAVNEYLDRNGNTAGTVGNVLNMKASAFFDQHEYRLADYTVRDLKNRNRDRNGSSVLGSKKSPYLLRDFLFDFPTQKALMRIFGIGANSAKRFKALCEELGLPFE